MINEVEEHSTAGFGLIDVESKKLTKHYVRTLFLSAIEEKASNVLEDLKKSVFPFYIKTKENSKKDYISYNVLDRIIKHNKNRYPLLFEFKISFLEWAEKYNLQENEWLLNIALETMSFWYKQFPGLNWCYWLVIHNIVNKQRLWEVAFFVDIVDNFNYWAPTVTTTAKLLEIKINPAFLTRKQAIKKINKCYDKLEESLINGRASIVAKKEMVKRNGKKSLEAHEVKVIKTEQKKNLRRDLEWVVLRKILNKKYTKIAKEFPGIEGIENSAVAHAVRKACKLIDFK